MCFPPRGFEPATLGLAGRGSTTRCASPTVFFHARSAALASVVVASVVDRPPLASAASNLASSSEATLVSTVMGTLLARGARRGGRLLDDDG